VVELREPVSAFAIGAHFEVQDRRLPRAELAEDSFVSFAGILELARGRDDGDARGIATGDSDEPSKHFGTADFFFGAPDGDDPAALGIGTHSSG